MAEVLVETVPLRTVAAVAIARTRSPKSKLHFTISAPHLVHLLGRTSGETVEKVKAQALRAWDMEIAPLS
jgi:hypothetical protein